MKRITILIVLVAVLSGPAFADDVRFVLSAMENHPEILLEAVPTYVLLGLEYTGFRLLDGKQTPLVLLGGGGYGHTDIWTGLDGMPLVVTPSEAKTDELTDQRTYNSWIADWRLRFSQFVTPLDGSELGELAVFLEYAGSWITPKENGTGSYGLDGTLSAYPDQDGLLTNAIVLGTSWSDLREGASPSGFEAVATLNLLPEFMANNILGRTNYTLLSTSFIGYIPLYTKRMSDGLNLVSIYLADRVVAEAVWGDAVPQRTQEPKSLGTKMRGFEDNSFGTAYTLVNNFEIRVAGPEIYLKNLYPRFHVFLDTGAYAGSYINTDYERNGFLMSTGFEASLTVLNIVSIGYRGTIVLVGENMAASRFVGGLMFSTQF